MGHDGDDGGQDFVFVAYGGRGLGAIIATPR